MMNFETGKLKQIATKIAREYGLCGDIQIILSAGSGKGDGYLGEIVRILAKDEEMKNTVNLIAKISLKDEKIRKSMPFAEIFENEIVSYEKILPALLNLQIEENVPVLFKPTAKFYSASKKLNEEYLILEDLRASGFETLHIKEMLQHDHVKVLCETYGNLHGLSFAMKILQNEKFCELASELKNAIGILFIEKKIGLQFPKIWDFIRSVMREKCIESELLDDYIENSFVMMKNMIYHKEEKFSCLLHGDCWSNNLMFRYKENNGHKKVEEVKLIDWQMCYIGPPVYDVSYSLYSGASKEVLANLGKYLKIYHESLSNALSQFNLDVNSVYPFEEMKRQWKKYYHYGAIVSGAIWKFRSFDENQGVDPLSHTSDDDSVYIEAIADAECNREFLFEHVKDLIDHLDEIAKGDIFD